jgi:hypothetical protein
MRDEGPKEAPVCSFEEISKALKRLGRRIPKAKVMEYVGYLNTCEILPPSMENGLLVCLLYEWEKSQEKTVVCKFDLGEEAAFPSVFLFGIISIDWPGMSDSCVGIFHEKKWNISFIKGTVIHHGEEMLGVVLVGVSVESKGRLSRLKRESGAITRSLKKVARGDRAKAWLIAREAERYETYMNTIRMIHKTYKGENLKELIGESGEAVKFFASRPVAYIHERRPADLAKQIVGNHEMLKRIKESGGMGQVRVGNIRTSGANLTGISIAGYEQDFTLDDCLRALNHVVPGFQIMFNKEFRTTEGIIVYRIEITDREGNAFATKDVKRISGALRELTRGRRFERTTWIEKFGGVEGYARALIPYLAREQKSSEITQVYITIGQTVELFAEFKILVVSGMDERRLERRGLKLLDRLDSAKGLSLVSYKTSRGPQNTAVRVVDLRADLAYFGGPGNALSSIRRILEEVVGEFRYFDEGGRIEESGKIEKLLAKLKGLDYLTVREIYFHLDDFYRLGADTDELAENIETVMSVLDKFKKSKKKEPIVVGRNISSQSSKGRSVALATVIAVVDRIDGKPIRYWLEPLQGYDVTVSKIEKEEAAILHFRVSEEGRPLSEPGLKKVVADFKRVLENVPGRTRQSRKNGLT